MQQLQQSSCATAATEGIPAMGLLVVIACENAETDGDGDLSERPHIMTHADKC